MMSGPTTRITSDTNAPDAITLDLPIPPSVNRLRKIDRSGLRALAHWRAAADKLVTAQWAAAKYRGYSRPSLAGQAVAITVHISERARIDADNAGKALLDYLTRIEVISDDRKKFVRRVTFEWVPPVAAPEGVRITVAHY